MRLRWCKSQSGDYTGLSPLESVRMQIHIENMTCGGCVRGVTRAIESVDAQAKIRADVATRHVEVNSVAAPEVLLAALQDAGYAAKAI